MSKRRIRDRKKRIRRIKRIRRGILSGTAVVSVAAVVIIAYQAVTPEPDKTQEPIAVIQTEPIAPEYILKQEKQRKRRAHIRTSILSRCLSR